MRTATANNLILSGMSHHWTVTVVKLEKRSLEQFLESSSAKESSNPTLMCCKYEDFDNKICVVSEIGWAQKDVLLNTDFLLRSIPEHCLAQT